MDYGTLFSIAGNALQAGNGDATNNSAQKISDAAYAQMLQNIQDRMAGLDSMGSAGYTPTEAQQLGPSELGNVHYNAQDEQAQQEALAQLKEISDRGGLTLADRNAVNQLTEQASHATAANQNALANAFAARGQLGSGAQMAMELQGNQQAANTNAQAGENQAAAAEQRAMQAISARGAMGASMGSADYARKADAAKANDIIAQRNAAARTANSEYNNKLKGQAWDDAMSIQKGKTGLTESLNNTIYGRGQSSANTVKANGSIANNLIGQGASALAKNSGKTSSADSVSSDDNYNGIDPNTGGTGSSQNLNDDGTDNGW